MNEEDRPIKYLESSVYTFKQPNLFAELSDEERQTKITAIAQESKASLSKSLNKIIEELLPSIHPLHVLAHFALYDNLIIPAFRIAGKHVESEYEPVTQSHIEFLQALILRLPANKLTDALEPNYPHIITNINEEIRKVFQSWSLSRLDNQSNTNHFIESIRSRTAIIRNWGNTTQVINWLDEMFTPDNGKLEQRYGISYSRLIHCVRMLFDKLEERINSRRETLRPILQSKTKEETISAYFKLQESSLAKEKEGYKRMMELTGNNSDLQHLLFTHYDRDLWKVFTFDLDDLKYDFTTKEQEGIILIFDIWSLEKESLEEKQVDHLFMDNPIWETPIIKLSQSSFYWPLLHVFQSFGLEMLSKLLSKAELDQFESITKPQFAENKVSKLMQEGFPEADIHCNTKYSVNNVQYENDCMLILDTYCLVIEVKSGKLRPSAKRGSDNSLKKGLHGLISAGVEQAGRFIKELKKQHAVKSKQAGFQNIKLDKVQHYIPFVITFEHLGEIATNKTELVQAGYLQKDVLKTICICLPDLEQIFKVLPSMSQRLHYFVRRLSIEQNFKFQGDEMDLLTFYLKTGFAIGKAEFEQEEFMRFTKLSNEIDPYLMDTTGEEPRPSRFLSPIWEKILPYVESRQNSNWTKVALMLLGCDKKTMISVEENVPAIGHRILNGKHKNGDDDIFLVVTGATKHEQAIVFTIGLNQSHAERKVHAQTALAMIKNDVGEIDVVIFAIDLGIPQEPYASLFLVHAENWKYE